MTDWFNCWACSLKKYSKTLVWPSDWVAWEPRVWVLLICRSYPRKCLRNNLLCSCTSRKKRDCILNIQSSTFSFNSSRERVKLDTFVSHRFCGGFFFLFFFFSPELLKTKLGGNIVQRIVFQPFQESMLVCFYWNCTQT